MMLDMPRAGHFGPDVHDGREHVLPQHGAQSIRVLDAVLQRQYQRIGRKMEAMDGAEGLKKAETGKFDLVLCDIKMPKMDGMEVLLKLQELNADMPVVMISGSFETMTVAEIDGLQLLRKPFGFEELARALTQAFESGQYGQRSDHSE